MSCSRCLIVLAICLAFCLPYTECKVKNCQRWYQDTCNWCNFGYGYTPDRKECIRCKDPNCMVCNNDQRTCPTCKEGYGFDKNKKCVKCTVSRCTVCQVNADTCGICEDGYGPTWEGDACRPCGDSNCRQCYADKDDALSECTQCKDGHGFLVSSKNKKCYECPNNLPGNLYCQNRDLLESEAASTSSGCAVMGTLALLVLPAVTPFLSTLV